MLYAGLILTFVLEYIRPADYFPALAAAKLNSVVPLTVFTFSLFSNTTVSHEEIWKSASTKWLTFFLVWIVLTMLIFGGPFANTKFTLALGYFFIFYSVCKLVDTKKKFDFLILSLGIIHVVIVILNPKLITNPESRTYLDNATFLGDGNDFALSLCVVTPLLFYLVLDAKSKMFRIFLIVLAMVCVLAIIGTQSRGASLALAGILIYLWNKSRKKILGLFALSVLVVAALLFASPQYFLRMGSISSYQTEGSAQARINAWKRSIFLGGVQNPVFGVGVGNFPLHNHGQTAHSIYFLALGDLGLPGIIFIISYLLGNIIRSRRRVKQIESDDVLNVAYHRMFVHVVASLIGFTVAGAFLSALYYPHLFVVGALAFSANHIYQKAVDGGLGKDEKENKLSAIDDG